MAFTLIFLTILVFIIYKAFFSSTSSRRIRFGQISQKESRRNRALLELVQTEKDYVQFLYVLYDNYYLPMVLQEYSYMERHGNNAAKSVGLQGSEATTTDAVVPGKPILDLEAFESFDLSEMVPPDLACILNLHVILLTKLEKSVLGIQSTTRIIVETILEFPGKVVLWLIFALMYAFTRKMHPILLGKDESAAARREAERYSLDNVNDDARVGTIFKRYAAAFRLYSDYVGHFENAKNNLNSFVNENSKFKSIITTEGRKLSKVKGNDLASLMVMPIQRTPRYCMLLNAILEHTDPSHGDYDDLVASLKAVQQSTSYINERARDIQRRLRVHQIQVELQQQCPGMELVEPKRYVVHECQMEHHGNEMTTNIILFNDIIVVKQTTIPKPSSPLSLSSIITSIVKKGGPSSIEHIYMCDLFNMRLHIPTGTPTNSKRKKSASFDEESHKSHKKDNANGIALELIHAVWYHEGSKQPALATKSITLLSEEHKSVQDLLTHLRPLLSSSSMKE